MISIGRAACLLALSVASAPAWAETAHETGARDEATVIMPEDPAMKKLWEEWGFSDAIVHGDTVWLSGVVASLRANETDQSVAFDRAFVRIGAILARAGVSWDDVVEMTTYHTDVTTQMKDFIAVKQRHVRAPYPAWTAIDVDRLIPEGGLVEIRVVAKKKR
jgi:enamine deaminase RidA (YjgF/YER057c/UK114 family)